MWPYTDLHVMSVVRITDGDSTPGSFAVLTGGVADGNDHKRGFVSIITFHQGECSLCEQTLAGLVLGSTRSAPTRFTGEAEPTNWEKSSWTLPS